MFKDNTAIWQLNDVNIYNIYHIHISAKYEQQLVYITSTQLFLTTSKAYITLHYFHILGTNQSKAK